MTLRQNYNREAPRLAVQVRRYAHAKLIPAHESRQHPGACQKTAGTKAQGQALQPGRHRGVECISKDKACQPYEFGGKVTVATTHKEGLVVGMRSFPGNPYEGHTLPEAIEQVSILTAQKPEAVFVDKGYGASVSMA